MKQFKNYFQCGKIFKIKTPMSYDVKKSYLHNQMLWTPRRISAKREILYVTGPLFIDSKSVIVQQECLMSLTILITVQETQTCKINISTQYNM